MHGMIRAGLSVSPCVSCGSLVCPLREIETSEPKQRFFRLVRSQRHLSTLGRLDSLERVMLFLAEMESRHRAEEPGSPVTRLQMSREDIADYLGLNAETVSRLLTRARKSGLVKFLNRSEYVLTDMEALARRLPVELPDPAFFRSGPDRKEPPQ